MGYARKDVEKTKKLAKKFVRYQEGAELYSIGLTKFQEIVSGDIPDCVGKKKLWKDEKQGLTFCHTKIIM